jgi:hypothetical protein
MMSWRLAVGWCSRCGRSGPRHARAARPSELELRPGALLPPPALRSVQAQSRCAERDHRGNLRGPARANRRREQDISTLRAGSAITWRGPHSGTVAAPSACRNRAVRERTQGCCRADAYPLAVESHDKLVDSSPSSPLLGIGRCRVSSCACPCASRSYRHDKVGLMISPF